MTELYVNNEQVTLPNKFSTEVIEGNPFINPIGETSLDISVSLLEPANAYIFGYLNRSNSKKDISQSLDCKMVVDAKEHHGKCIILEFSDEEIKIQLVFKNSIFSHAIDENLKIKDLNLGTAIIDKDNIVNNLNKTYPDVDFQLLLVFNPDYYDNPIFEGEFLNRFTYVVRDNRYNLTYAYDGSDQVDVSGMFANSRIFVKREQYSPQPYLSAILRILINSLGFKMGINEIADHPIFKYAIIVNGATSLKYVDMLPDWTVKKFIEQVQTWQNCRFIYNSVTERVDIRYNHLNSENAVLTELEVLDDFTGSVDDSDPFMNRELNIEYNLPDTDNYKYYRLKKELKESFQTVTISSGTLQEAITSLMAHGNPEWIYRQGENVTLVISDGRPRIVDEYATLQNNLQTESSDATLDIVPAEMSLIKFYFRERMSNSMASWFYVMVPVNRDSTSGWNDQEENVVSVDEAIQDSSLITSNSESRNLLQIVLYNGFRQTTVHGTSATMPYDGLPESFIRNVSDIYPEGSFHKVYSATPEVQNPLSLQFLNEQFYMKEMDIDTSKLFRFRFLHPMQDLDITNIFVINSEYYQAFQFHKTITSDGMSEVIEGEFYKLK